jgi:hypothetical protein
LTRRREILEGEGEKYLEGKERNTWRGRREILEGEGEKYLEGKEVKIHSQQEEKGGNFKTSEGTQFDCVGVRVHIYQCIYW